eukprot:13986366-Alexandrium_andersonii.AAC.1
MHNSSGMGACTVGHKAVSAACSTSGQRPAAHPPPWRVSADTRSADTPRANKLAASALPAPHTASSCADGY